MKAEEFNLASLGDWNKDAVADEIFNDAPEIIDGTTAEDVVSAIEEDEEEDVFQKPEETKDTKKVEIDWDEDNPNPGADEVETPFDTLKKKEQTSDSQIITSTKFLIEKGILDFELEEGEELNEDIALELLEEGFEKGVENRIEDLLQGLPNELQALNKYVLSGGDMNEFLVKMSTIGKSSGISSTLDMSSEANQELVIKQMYQDEGMDDDFIEAQIETLRDTGKLETFARKRFEKWKEQDKDNSQKEAKKQEEYARQQREKARQYYSNLKNTVNKEEFEGIKLSPKDKTEIPSYMTERKVKLENGNVVTPFNQGLMEVLQNEKASIQLAKMLRDRKNDGTFDFSHIEKVATTKVAREVKNNIRRNKDIPRKSVETNSQSKSLADYFS